ncbi:MAG: hypothetical protein QM690_10340 [Sphingobium sp.]
MSWLLVLLTICLGAELFERLPIARTAALTMDSCARAGRIFLSPHISDHWKERVMPAYALRMGRLSLNLMGCFLMLAATGGFALAMLEKVEPSAALFLCSALGLSVSFLIAFLYHVARGLLVRA